MKRYSLALITGASSGIGFSFANLLAKDGSDLILIARNTDRLTQVKSEIENKYSVKVFCFSYDLTNPNCMEEINQFLDINRLNPDLVINNAGAGIFGPHAKVDLNTELDVIKLNIMALTTVTKALILRMEKNGEGTILNVSSTLALHKSPFWAVYSASKSYVLSYTRTLELEMRNSKIHLSVLVPGKTDTEFDNNAGISYSRQANKASPDRVANYTLKKLKQGTRIIIPGFNAKLKYFVFRYIPDSFTEFLIRKS